MFRKIHSNRDPKDTVYSELKKEFAVYFAIAGKSGRAICDRYPVFLFGLMIFSIVLSIVLSFTVFRATVHVVKKPQTAKVNPVSDSFSEILRTGSALRETIALKKEVDSITEKKTLNKADSAALLKDLDKLQQINNQPQGAHEHLEKNNTPANKPFKKITP